MTEVGIELHVYNVLYVLHVHAHVCSLSALEVMKCDE